MSESSGGDATRALAALREGDPAAADRLMTLVYDQLRALAGSYFRGRSPSHTLQPTALVHEAFIRIVNNPDIEWKDRAHFFALCATAMRRILADHARRKRAAKRGGERRRVTLTNEATPSLAREIDVIDLDDALTRLATLNERQARIVECRFFSGMTIEEAAQALGVSRRTVDDDWAMARAWLSVQLSEHDAR